MLRDTIPRADDLTRRRWFVGLDYMVQWIEGATVWVSVTVVFRVLQHDVRLYRSRWQRIVGKRERAPRLVSLRLGGGLGIVLVEDTGTFRSGVLALLLSHGEATQSFVDLLIVICRILCNRLIDVNDLIQINKTIYLNKTFYLKRFSFVNERFHTSNALNCFKQEVPSPPHKSTNTLMPATFIHTRVLFTYKQ